MSRAYPVMLNLKDQPCLVVGGGKVAERKISRLLEAGAAITVVSPRHTDRIADWIQRGEVTARIREYASTDGEGMRLVFAATDSEQVNRRVWQDARARGQWANVADHPELGDFIVPALERRGRLEIAVSTSGASPSLASHIARRLAAQFDELDERVLEAVYQLRKQIIRHVDDVALRTDMLRTLATEDWLNQLRESVDQTSEVWMRRLEEHVRMNGSQGRGTNR